MHVERLFCSRRIAQAQVENPRALATLQETSKVALEQQRNCAAAAARRAKARGDAKPSRLW